MSLEAELRDQLTNTFEDADYPIEDKLALLPALPNGPATTFEAQSESFSAMELATHLDGHQNFPYESHEALVDDIIAGMKAENLI